MGYMSVAYTYGTHVSINKGYALLNLGLDCLIVRPVHECNVLTVIDGMCQC